MYLGKLLLIAVMLVLSACSGSTEAERGMSRLTIGAVSYGTTDNAGEKYADFKQYLGSQLHSVVELEPVYNEVKALEQIARQKWDLVFAPPGLAAIANSRYNYSPLVPLESGQRTRSVITVRYDSEFEKHQDLAGEVIALGQRGSATGYYLPIYNLYGLHFAEVKFAPTPNTILNWIEEEKIAAGALSMAEFHRYRRNFEPNKFKVIHVDSHAVPPGAILVSDRLDDNSQEQIKELLAQTPSFIAASVGFLPNEQPPNYDYLVRVIERVRPIAESINDRPALLYEAK